ncbi:hypothetical protein TIFTF001_025195 [Ficus carica]|uniref:Uncharacterized protein n=1 Tax=Ficus carica TaxID=3494 RepID=A0AA88AQW6_FICCA|nr:hypothetical protein TIFTF001_025195 [Ficus carica]
MMMMFFGSGKPASTLAVVGFADRHDRSRSEKPASTLAVAGFLDRPDRDRSCRSGKPCESGRSGKSVSVYFGVVIEKKKEHLGQDKNIPDRPGQSCRSGKPAKCLLWCRDRKTNKNTPVRIKIFLTGITNQASHASQENQQSVHYGVVIEKQRRTLRSGKKYS